MHAAARRALLLLSLAPFGAAHAAALEDSRPLAAGQAFVLRAEAGRVSIVAGETGRVDVSAALEPGQRLLWREGGDRLVLRIDDGERLRPRAARVQVAVPVDADLLIDLGDAALDLAGVGGRSLRVRGGAGDVDLATTAEAVSVETVSGGQTIRVDGGRLKAASLSGSIRLDARASETVSVDTVRGRVELGLEGGGEMRLSSVSGPIVFRPADTATLRARIDSLSGDVELRLPAGQALELGLAQAKGRVELPAAFTPLPDGGRRLGEGGGRIEVKSFSGNVFVRVLPAGADAAAE